jgi:hypothetical protein
VTELLAVKLSTFEPFSFVFGESEISAVWISAGAMPAFFTAAIRRFIRAALAVSAALAVDAVVETPKVNCASSGTVVTIPVP